MHCWPLDQNSRNTSFDLASVNLVEVHKELSSTKDTTPPGALARPWGGSPSVTWSRRKWSNLVLLKLKSAGPRIDFGEKVGKVAGNA